MQFALQRSAVLQIDVIKAIFLRSIISLAV